MHSLPASSMEANIALRLSEGTPSVHFIKVDVDQAQDVSEEYGIRAMPTFMIFKNGEKAGEVVGAKPQEVEALISRHA